jgi:DNA topoisomerase-1
MADHPPTAKSNARISPEDVKKIDAEVPHTDHVEPGISIRMGPIDAEDKMDVDAPETNGKRKARSSITNGKSYKDASSSEEDDKPLVSRSHVPPRDAPC